MTIYLFGMLVGGFGVGTALAMIRGGGLPWIIMLLCVPYFASATAVVHGLLGARW